MTSPHRRFSLALAGIVATVGLGLAQAPAAVADTSWGRVAPSTEVTESPATEATTPTTPATNPAPHHGKKRSPIADS